MVLNFNMDLETRMANMYKALAEPKSGAEDRKEMTADEFWSSMRMVATNNQVQVNINYKNR